MIMLVPWDTDGSSIMRSITWDFVEAVQLLVTLFPCDSTSFLVEGPRVTAV